VIALLDDQARSAQRTLPAAVHAYDATGSGDETAASEAEARAAVLADVLAEGGTTPA
jgi:hypothetical protein